MASVADTYPCVEINAPEWYKRADFMDWLASGLVATWYAGTGEPNEHSDIFVLYDHGEGSDSYDMPEDIWQEICNLIHHPHCVVRITNLEE